MRLSELKETTLHGLRGNNSPVSPVVLLLLFFFAEVWYLYTQVENLKIFICLCIAWRSYTSLVCLDIFAYLNFLDLLA